MATSDNVLRAGLTPKARDVANLVSSLTYSSSDPSKHLVQPTHASTSPSHTLIYDPPIPEFTVSKTTLDRSEREIFRKIAGPSVVIITHGTGRFEAQELEELKVQTGNVLFVGAGIETSVISGEEGIEMFRAFVEA
jgi:mannose-6-phosphate isomerase